MLAEIKTVENMLEAGKRYLIGIDYTGCLANDVLDELYLFEKERNSKNAWLFDAAAGMIIHASIKALGAGIAIGTHVERRRRKRKA